MLDDARWGDDPRDRDDDQRDRDRDPVGPRDVFSHDLDLPKVWNVKSSAIATTSTSFVDPSRVHSAPWARFGSCRVAISVTTMIVHAIRGAATSAIFAKRVSFARFCPKARGMLRSF